MAQNLRTGEIRVLTTPEPMPGPHAVLVQTSFSLISAGTERSKVDFGRSSLLGKARKRPDDVKKVLAKVRRDGLLNTYHMVTDRLEQASPLGYSAAGIVLGVGELVAGVGVGDRVACAGAGYANHAEQMAVPGNLCVFVPEGVPLDEAAFTTLGAIALQGFRQSGAVVGDVVGVIGLGLLGLITVQLAKAAGCRVLGIDVDAAKTDLALALGADAIAVQGADESLVIACGLSGSLGLDAVIITAGTRSDQPVVLAGELARDRGTVVIVGDVGLSIPRKTYYEKELNLRLSRSYGPGRYDPAYEEFGGDYPEGYVKWTERRNMEEFLRLVKTGHMSLQPLITHRFPVDRAPEAYDLVAGKVQEPFIGVLLEYPQLEQPQPTIITKPSGSRDTGAVIGVSFVGAGNFATGTLLPALKGQPHVNLRNVVTASGLGARDVADRHGFERALPSAGEAIADPETSVVAIATRHTTHADLVIKVLAAGKTAFVEKPLATTREELAAVVDAWRSAPGDVLVGFNRRFAPLTAEVKDTLSRLNLPVTIQCRVNAGALPPEHWAQLLEEGAGRIIGEMCHFVDLVCYLVGSSPASAYAQALRNGKSAALQDSLTATFGFANGSIATVTYCADGDTAYPKELVEVFCGGHVMVIDDFRELRAASGGRVRTRRLAHVDKGHTAEMKELIALARGEASRVLPFSEAVTSTEATFCVIESLTVGLPVRVTPPIVVEKADADR